MKPLTEVLRDFNEARDMYDILELKLISDQSEILRRLSVCNSHLAEHRIDAHTKWLSYQYNSTAKSQSGKDREADMKTPELYQIRHIMTAVKLLMDSVRSTISTHKKEQ